jgi:site-specific DNA recombinase
MTIQTKIKGADPSDIVVLQQVVRVAVYGRVSTDNQAKKDNSLPNQKERLEALAKYKGWEIVGYYFDEGESGAKENRPQLDRLMEDAKMHKFDIVAVIKVDRFMRSCRHLHNAVHTFDELGIGFYSESEGINTLDKSGMGRIILSLFGSLAEYELEQIHERIKSGRGRLARKGQFNSGRPPYGYQFDHDDIFYKTHDKSEPKPLIAFEDEAKAVRFIFGKFSEANGRLGIGKVAEMLNLDTDFTPPQTPGRKNKKYHFWIPGAVGRIARSSVYYGAPNEGYKYAAEPLISKEVWDKTQYRIDHNGDIKGAGEKITKYQGHIKCGICGLSVRPGYNHGLTGTVVYVCAGRNKDAHLDGKTEKCKLNRFPAAVVDAAIEAKIHELRTNPEVLKSTLEKSLAELKADLATISLKVKPLEERRVRIRRQIEGYNALVTAGEMDADDYLKKIEPLKKDEKDLERREKVIDPNLNTDIEFKKMQINEFEKGMDILFNGDLEHRPGVNYEVAETIEILQRLFKKTDFTNVTDEKQKKMPFLPFLMAIVNDETPDNFTAILTNVDGDKKAVDVELRIGKTSAHSDCMSVRSRRFR